MQARSFEDWVVQRPAGSGSGVGTLLFGIVICVVSCTLIVRADLEQQQQDNKTAARAVAAEQVKRTRAAAERQRRSTRLAVKTSKKAAAARLRASFPQFATKFSRKIKSLGALKPKDCAAVAHGHTLDTQLAHYDTLVPPPDGLATLRQRLSAAIAPAKKVCQATRRLAAARRSTAAGDQLREKSECVDAERSYRSAIALFKTIGPDAALLSVKVNSEVRKLSRRIKRMSRCTRRDMRRRAAAQAHKEKVAAAQAEAARQKEAQQALWETIARKCGKKPDPLRAAMSVKLFLYPNAHDPSSIDVKSCSPAQLTTKCWKTRCRYYARNGFGALVQNASTFYLKASREHKYVWLILGMD